MSDTANPSAEMSNDVGTLQRELSISKSLSDNSPINIILANTDLVIT